MASDYSFLFVDTISSAKVVYLPAASSIPGRILCIKDIYANSPASSIFISTASGDMIDYRPNTLYATLSTFGTAVKLASNGSNNWMVLSQYTSAIGKPPPIPPPAPPPPPPPPPPIAWSTIIEQFGGYISNTGGGQWEVAAFSSTPTTVWSYITHQFPSSGSFTYNFGYYEVQQVNTTLHAFEFVSALDLYNSSNVNFSNTIIASNNGESGTRTINFAANDWVALGVWVDNSGFNTGAGTLYLSNIPTSNP